MRPQLKILVVSQDPDAVKRASQVLLEHSIEPSYAASAQEIEAAIEHEKFDGVFVDSSTLLRGGGSRLTQRLRRSQSNAKTPLIAFSENAACLREAFRTGATFIVPMPLQAEGIRKVLRAAWGAMLEEHRRYRRIPVMTSVRCRWANKEVKATSRNLSTGGMFVTIEDPPPPRSPIFFEFRLPGTREHCRLKGEVVRVVEGRGVGVRFDPMDWLPQRSIHEFIEKTHSTLS